MSVLDVPGMITQREEVTVSSDEEDVHFGTFAPLKKGDEKKKALREVGVCRHRSSRCDPSETADHLPLQPSTLDVEYTRNP